MRGSKVGRRALDRVAPGGLLVQACDCLVGEAASTHAMMALFAQVVACLVGNRLSRPRGR